VFSIDTEVCARCGGSAKIISFIEDQGVIPDKAAQALASFRREGFQLNSTKSARKPLKNSLA
jgi:hypothetical protein